MHILFIYGTLKKHCRNAHIMNSADYLGEAVTQDTAWDILAIEQKNHYPFPALTHGTHKIRGELYRMDDALLQTLDEFELALPAPDQEYERVSIALDNGRRAQTYLALPELAKTAKSVHPYIISDENIKIWEEKP